MELLGRALKRIPKDAEADATIIARKIDTTLELDLSDPRPLLQSDIFVYAGPGRGFSKAVAQRKGGALIFSMTIDPLSLEDMPTHITAVVTDLDRVYEIEGFLLPGE